jgi:hypothetical protein
MGQPQKHPVLNFLCRRLSSSGQRVQLRELVRLLSSCGDWKYPSVHHRLFACCHNCIHLLSSTLFLSSLLSLPSFVACRPLDALLTRSYAPRHHHATPQCFPKCHRRLKPQASSQKTDFSSFRCRVSHIHTAEDRCRTLLTLP